MNKFEQLISGLKLQVNTPEMDSNFLEIPAYSDNIDVIPGKW